MLKRNTPVFAFMFVFVTMLYFVYSIPRYEPVVEVEEEENVVENAFTGYVNMPSIDEIYVLDNSAGRDLNKIAMFLEGRAAGLHYLSLEYFKKVKAKRKGQKFFKPDDEVFLGLRLTLDSLGRFRNPQIMFSNSDDDVFNVKLLKHVEYFWRLPRSESGQLEIWIPIRFHAS